MLSPSVNPLSFLRNQPQFQVMRQLIQQNAALLPALLQEIGRENPELLQVKHVNRLMCVGTLDTVLIMAYVMVLKLKYCLFQLEI